MNDIENFYITASKLRSLVYRSGIVVDDLSHIYRDILDPLGLRDFISKSEAKTLQATSVFLQQSEEYLIELAKNNKFNRSDRGYSEYVFPPGAPRYHANRACKTLLQDFENFRIPEEIKERGGDEIARFREFARANRNLVRDGRKDVFEVRLQNHFNLTEPIDEVLYENSGVELLVENWADLDLGQLGVELRHAADQLQAIGETDGGEKALRDYRYAAPVKALKIGNLTPDARQVLTVKMKLISLLTRYTIKKYSSGDQVFPKRLLQVYGFQPCGLCCEDEIEFDLS